MARSSHHSSAADSRSRFRKKNLHDMPSQGFSSSIKWLVSAPLLLATITFLVYLPSLKSDFVYDARTIILSEGFVSSLANFPTVLSLKVLSMNLILADRPGELLYLMINFAIWGKQPWGYHLSNNLLHAANVALFWILLRRLVSSERETSRTSLRLQVECYLAVIALLFALHPIATEAVSQISYSSDLLVAFFTLLTLLAATAFHPKNAKSPLFAFAAVFCAFAAVTCKESGMAASLLLLTYWYFFRREDAKRPWLLLLGAALATTFLYLVARFHFAAPNQDKLPQLGGDLVQTAMIQPQLWVFMMGQLFWPHHLSADYTLSDSIGFLSPVAPVILAIVLFFQGWLAIRSRIGALGVAIYWLSLITVSNFVPLYRPLADRFYYWPLAGALMQLLALLLLIKSQRVFLAVIAACAGASIPLTIMTLDRQQVFTNDFALWSDTIQASPLSSTAHHNLALIYKQEGNVDEALIEYKRTLEILPTFASAHLDMGIVLFEKGQIDAAIAEFQKCIDLDPSIAGAHYNLGYALLQEGKTDDAIVQFRASLDKDPLQSPAHYNLGKALMQEGRDNEAITQYQEAIKIDPTNTQAHENLGVALGKKGDTEQAIQELQKAVELNPASASGYSNLGNVLAEEGKMDQAIVQYQKALVIDPHYIHARFNLGSALLQQGDVKAAIEQFQAVLKENPEDATAQNNLLKAEARLSAIKK